MRCCEWPQPCVRWRCRRWMGGGGRWYGGADSALNLSVETLGLAFSLLAVGVWRRQALVREFVLAAGALALGLNGRSEEAGRQMRLIQALFGPKMYAEARADFLTQHDKYPQLARVVIP